MKVLIVSVFPPAPAPEANHALHLSEQLAASGVAVHVLCRRGSIAPTRPGITVHALMERWDWREVPRLEACLRESRPDAVLLLYIGWVFNHHPMITYLPTFCARVLPGVPCITQFENVDKGAPPRPLLERARRKAMALRAGAGAHPLFGTLLRDSARIIALSSPHRAGLLAQDPDIEEKTEILPPPPLIRSCTESPPAARRHARSLLGAAPGTFLWMYWGYIYPGKGVETLLRAFRTIVRRDPDARLALVGGPLDFPTGPISCRDYYRMVRRLPASLGLEQHVVWTGAFSWDSDEGSRYLHGADGCVLPFDYGVTLNNSSLAAATTHALPVLATTLPVGADDMLEHGRNVLLCPPRDHAFLAEAMQAVAKRSELRERLRAGARELAARWHAWQPATRRLIAILDAASTARAAPSARCARPADEPVARTLRAAEPVHPAPEPPVSVVVAVHDVARYLSQCLDALVHQTLAGVEIVVVNDASTDRGADIIREYQARHPAIRAIHCERNQGLATVRNIGMRAARGRYIAFADGDDWVDTRMCEVMYRRAEEDDADVVIADAHVYYEDSKHFGPFFDQALRRTLDPALRTLPFELVHEPRVLLLEPVAWTKLYKRAFLETHDLRFEDGMNSYEDICFHFSVLLKAGRIVLIDEALAFYRQNRPGQISGRTSRRVFEVFEVFRRIHANLSAWGAAPEIWALLVRVQLRQFDWLLRDRLRPAHKREFLRQAAATFACVPRAGMQRFIAAATAEEVARLHCIRRGWLRGYQRLARQRWPLAAALYALVREPRPAAVARRLRGASGRLRRMAAGACRAFVSKAANLAVHARQWQTAAETLSRLAWAEPFLAPDPAPVLEVCRVAGRTLFLSQPAPRAGLADALWRVEQDYYLTRLAVLRPGDVVVDVGAHVGVLALTLALRHPYVTVYALEPDPHAFACLQHNIATNRATNVIALNLALTADAAAGATTLYTDAGGRAWATIEPRAAASRHLLRTARVDTITLERLFDRYGLRYCRLLKLTAPGAVPAALAAFGRSHCVDLLCGEAELDPGGPARLESESWRIARQHFWRIAVRRGERLVQSWLQRLPEGMAAAPGARSAPDAAPAVALDLQRAE